MVYAYETMEVTVAVLALPAVYFSVVIIRWGLQRRFRLQLFKRYGIPGPEPSFWSGNMYQLKAAPTPNDVITSWLKRYGSVFGYYIGDIPHIVINDLDILKQIMIKDFHLFTNRAELLLDVSPLNRSILFLKDRNWRDMRSILSPSFTSGKIKLMTHVINKKVDVTLDVVSAKAERGEMFDMYEVVQGLTLDVIADCALAMKTHCQANPRDIFLIAVRDFFRYAYCRVVDWAVMFPFLAKLMKFVYNFVTPGMLTTLIVNNVRTAIAARRKDPSIKSVDFLQFMLDGKIEGKDGKTSLTDEEIVANAYVLLLGGYETTATALGFTFYLLVKHPEIQQKLYQEIKAVDDCSYATIQSLEYLDQVFCESLRMYPPLTGFLVRSSAQDYQVGSFTIPKGSNVQAPIWDIHHDPDLWPDPYTFDPERFCSANKASIKAMSYMPFGVGPRNCMGARFAQLEAKLALFKLVKKFRFEKCERTDDPLPLICPTVIINPANGIYVRAVLRNSAS